MEDEEDFVFYGTPIEREEELTSRKKKAVAEASGHLRTLPSWKQEVRDEEGRRRFHGAFTGGFSAGYYNTVGSKEGWTPQTFTSSRKNRAEVKQQSILNFFDDDEKSEYEGRSLRTSSQFDTFGFTAAEFARKQAEKEQENRPSAIPGPVPDEIVLPAAESIGIKLLLKMGWRHGRSIKDSRENSLYDARREARKAFLAFSSDVPEGQRLVDSTTVEDKYDENFPEQSMNDDIESSQSIPVVVRNPKQDLYGLGFDPYEHAPEFRDKKNLLASRNKESGNKKALNMKNSLFGLKSGKPASGFGIGALEEYDAEDEDIYDAELYFEDTYVQEPEEPSRSIPDNKHRLVWKEHGALPGFKSASNTDYQMERFDPPVIPKDFVPHHKFLAPLEVGKKHDIPPPEEVPPPGDNNLKILIDGVATLVARCGKLFEDLSREKNQSNPSFSFLNGGNGSEYYARRLWEEQQKREDQKKLPLDGKSSSRTQEMSAESRGRILGERPLERSSKDLNTSPSDGVAANVNLQFNLSDTFMKPALFSELPEVAKPFKDDPAKQQRFERFLKEKYKGGLRSTCSGASSMSEAARARERLDFEAAAEAIEKTQRGNEQKSMEFSAYGGMQFTSAEHEGSKATEADLATEKLYPKREQYEWRPSPILCKRFDLIDPYMGKPPPPPRIRSKMDSLIKTDSLLFTSDLLKPTKVEEHVKADRDQLAFSQFDTREPNKDVDDGEITAQQEVQNLERPVDLYKAIFSDDSDDETETPSARKVEDPEKKIEVAQTALNRLIAGDFLESLGKELGLEVPPELTLTAKAKTCNPQKGTAGVGSADIAAVEGKLSSASKTNSATPASKVTAQGESLKINDRNPSAEGNEFRKPAPSPSDSKINSENIYQKDRKAKTPNSDDKGRNDSSSSEDERSIKHSKRRRHRSSDSYSSDSSDDHRYRSRDRKKSSSREKRSSRKRSKHHKHGRRDSPSRSSHHERNYAEAKKEKRKSRD